MHDIIYMPRTTIKVQALSDFMSSGQRLKCLPERERERERAGILDY
jgi:hypothetical protein